MTDCVADRGEDADPSTLKPDFWFDVREETLLDRVVPYQGESLLSIFTRMVGLSGHLLFSALAQKIEIVGKSPDQIPWLSDHAAIFSKVSGYPIEEINARMLPSISREDQSRSFVAFNGVPLREHFVSTVRRAVSPASLRKAPYHRMTWDLTHLGFCPESREILISSCPKCLRPLAWRGSSVCHCHYCGFDLREHRAKRMHSATAKSLYQLADLLSHSPQVRERAHAALPAEIRSLDAGEIWHASMLLGLAVEATGDGNVNDLRTRFIRGSKEASAPQIMSAGFFLLQDLDEYFDDLVTEIRDKAKLAPSLSPVRAELGILHDLIDPAVVGDATTAIFEARLKRYYRSRYRFNDTRTSAIVLLRWCDQVMSSDEVVNGAPSKFAARRMMTFRELRVGRGAIYKAYDRSSVETLIDGLRDAKAMSILMTESGMPRKVFDRLIEAGRLRPAATLVARLLGPGRVSDSDWRAWLHAVESGIQSPQGSTAIKFSAAVRLLGGGAVGWNRVLDLIEKGHVPLISVNDQTTRLGLRWNVCRRRLGEHLPRHDGESGASLTAVLASEGIRASKALELARLKVVQTTTAATIPPVALLEQAELRRFKENYVTAATLSAELGLALKIVPLWLREGGVSIIGNGRPVIYHRADVEALLDKGVRLYRNIGRPASPQTIAQLQYLKVPGDITIDFVSNKQSHVTPQKLPQIRMLLDILEGRSFDQIADAVGKQAIQTFCFSTRRRGVEHHVSRRKTSKSRLSSEQRMLLEKEIRRFISAKNADVRISQAKLVEHVRETFGIDYDKTSISAIVRRSGMTWPTDVRVLSRLTESQRVAFKSYSQSIADRIRAGEPGLSRKTLIKWIEDQFDIRVSLASVTKYNRDLGVDWPRIAGQKIHKIVRVDVKVR